MTVAAPSAPLAKGNKQGTGVLAALPRDAIRLQCRSSGQGAGQRSVYLYIKQRERLYHL